MAFRAIYRRHVSVCRSIALRRRSLSLLQVEEVSLELRPKYWVCFSCMLFLYCRGKAMFRRECFFSPVPVLSGCCRRFLLRLPPSSYQVGMQEVFSCSFLSSIAVGAKLSPPPPSFPGRLPHAPNRVLHFVVPICAMRYTKQEYFFSLFKFIQRLFGDEKESCRVRTGQKPIGCSEYPPFKGAP